MRALVAGWIGSTNLGDELVFLGLIRHLDALGLAPIPISVDPARTRSTHDLDSVRHRGPLDTVGLWRGSRGFDAVIFGGGGLIQDQTSAWNVPFHIGRLMIASRGGRPWAGVGLGADDLSSSWARWIASRGLRSPVGFAVRDAGSEATARQMGIDTTLAADLAVGLDSPESSVRDRLVVILRSATRRGPGTASAKAAQAVEETWETALAASLDRLAADLGADVQMLAFQPDRDQSVHARVSARMTTPAALTVATLDSVLESMARAHCVVTMRYHGAIAALIAGSPAVLLGYSPKMTHIAADVGAAFQVTQLTEVTGERVDGLARSALAHAGDLPEALRRLRERELGNRAVLERLAEAAR